MKRHIAIGLTVFWATPLLAHSPLEVTVPADGAVVAEAPTAIVMGFKGDTRLTRVTLTHAGTYSARLNLDGFDGFVSNYTIPLQPRGDGLYEIEWRGLGDDGHALSGAFSFTVED